MLIVKLFGPGQATYLDHPLTGFPNQQAWQLLCYLLLNKRHVHSRERLAVIFWEEQSTHTARKNFRNTLWRLRQMLLITGMDTDGYLQINDESVNFCSYAPLWLDVDVFEAAGRLAHLPHTEMQPDQVAELEAAVDLYTGDLLENIYADWCIYDRERFRLLNLNMLQTLMVYHAARGSVESSLHYGERILSGDNTREDIHRQMMWIYWRSGQANAALAQYRLCARILQDEVGVHPMESTRQLYEMILHSSKHQTAWITLPPRDAPAAHPAAHIPPTPGKPGPLPVAEHALQQIRRLEQVLEETRAELRQMEWLISQLMADNQKA